MGGLENGMLLLSSRERKGLFRAVQKLQRERAHLGEEWSERLLDELDDGGIWNPCFLVLPNDDDQLVMVRTAMAHGEMELPEFEHECRALLGRTTYVSNRRDGGKKFRRWPFVMSDGYYGPNWEEKREQAIDRDGGCTECGMERDAHQNKYGEDIHVHHIVPLSECRTYEEANALENLRTLCKEHHLVEHRKVLAG